MTGFVSIENVNDKWTLFVIIDIDTEKLIAELVPIKSESKIKLKTHVGTEQKFKVISVKPDHTIL